jgi:hypothetical protein
MGPAFEHSIADFSALAVGDRAFAIDDVAHSVFVAVDEEAPKRGQRPPSVLPSRATSRPSSSLPTGRSCGPSSMTKPARFCSSARCTTLRAFPVRMRSRERLYPFDIVRKSSSPAIPPARDLR